MRTLAIRVCTLAVVAALSGVPVGLADTHRRGASPTELIAEWARSGEAMRRRSEERELPPRVASAVLAALGEGARPCDCLGRRLRWAWPLRRAGESRHPRLVVGFVDAVRDPRDVSEYARVALLRFMKGRYVVTSTMAFPRPASARGDADLAIRVLGKRDLDGDGEEDIALRVEERAPGKRVCSSGRFMTGKVEASLDVVPCDGAAEPR